MPTTSPADRLLSRRILAAGLALGLLAELLFDGRAFGINVAIGTAGLLGAAWLLRRPDRAPDPLDAWLPVSAGILALLVAVRGDPFLAVLDSLVALACCGASAAAFSGLAVTRRTASVIAAMGAWVIGSAVADPFRSVIESRPAPGGEPRRLPEWVVAVARGLVVAVPLAMIFAVLFASADPVFARAVGDVLGFRIDLGELPGRILFVVAAGWLAAGVVSVSARGIPAFEGASLGAASRTGPDPGHARARAAGGARDPGAGRPRDRAVRRPPVRLPVRRLDRRERDDLRDYARRGFFELVAAACPVSGRRDRARVDRQPPVPAVSRRAPRADRR